MYMQANSAHEYLVLAVTISRDDNDNNYCYKHNTITIIIFVICCTNCTT